MPSFKKRYEAKQKKDAISLLNSFIRKIKDGEFVVDNAGWWSGMEGTHNLKVSVKESEKLKDSDQS